MTFSPACAFIDLQTQQARIKKSLTARMNRVLSHGMFILGPEVQELEAQLVSFSGAKHCISCANGTDALVMALMAYGIGRGDLVFVPTFTFVATAEAVSLAGAEIRFVDVDSDTFNMDPDSLRREIARHREHKNLRPAAIIAVDLFGHPAPYRELDQIARSEGLVLMSDAAQSFGATYHGKRTGSITGLTTTSFFPAKPLGCYGDGGAIFCHDDSLAQILRSVRAHGQGQDRYDNVRMGLNGRLDTLQAAILLAKLEIFEDEVRARDKIARRYTENLCEYFKTPTVRTDCASAWAQYSIVVNNRSAVQSALKAAEIPTMIYYPRPLHRQPVYAELAYPLGSFAVSEYLSDHILSLPMHPYLDTATQDRICAVLRDSLS